MSLYVRVFTSFYTHRKTLRLRVTLGNDALWVPPRLWAYAASDQPDGVFEDYSAEEIAMLIGYIGNAQAMLQAMLQARFLDSDPLRIHGWAEHNGVHTVFAERARVAANARWGKERERTKEKKEKTVQDSTRQEPSIAGRMLEASAALEVGGIGPEWEIVLRWLDGWKKSGADYTEFEARGAFLALQAGGWRWGRNPVADHRAAIERQIQTDRDKKHTHGRQAIDRNANTANAKTIGDYDGIGKVK